MEEDGLMKAAGSAAFSFVTFKSTYMKQKKIYKDPPVKADDEEVKDDAPAIENAGSDEEKGSGGDDE